LQVTNTAGVGVNLRAAPGTSQPILGGLDDEASVVELGGPTSADGVSWVKVRDGAGQVGWVDQQYLVASGPRG
jgi:uncharacterized protein YraI